MDDFYTVLVDPHVSLDDAEHEAARLIAWLQANEFIGPAEFQKEYARSSESSYIKGDNVVYRPGLRFRNASDGDYLLKVSNNYLSPVDIQGAEGFPLRSKFDSRLKTGG